jgi:hypothetical protein
MKNGVSFLLALFSVSVLFAQKPEWMKPHPEGKSVFIQGLLVDRVDSLQVIPGEVIVTNVENSHESYTFSTNKTGVFQFHLWENSLYTASFSSDGYITRKIEFDTHDVPDKAWKKGCDIDVKMALDKKPSGFKELVSVLPFATFKYDIEERLFLFDLSKTDAVIERYEQELNRAREAEKSEEKNQNPNE